MSIETLPKPLRITGPDGTKYTTYTVKHYQAFERGMDARKSGRPETACPFRSEELVAFWLAGYNSPTHNS